MVLCPTVASHYRRTKQWHYGVYQEVQESLRTLWNDADLGRTVVGQQRLMERQQTTTMAPVRSQ